jgi:hypothetical protein
MVDELHSDNRKEKRFKAVEGALAGFSSRDVPSVSILGEIIDISKAGLSARYKSREQIGSASDVSIFAYKEPFINIEGIPCRIVYDIGLDATTRRCGVEFGDLAEDQLSQLEDFIKYYTSDEA